MHGRRICVAALSGVALAFAGIAARAQVRISSLPAASALTGSELIPAVQGGGNVVLTPSSLLAFVNASQGGGGGSPGGSSGQLQYDNAGVFGGFTLAGDCTISVPTITCAKTSGNAFGTAAIQNIGTSGATIPLLNGNNTESGAITFSGTVTGAALSSYLASPPAIGGAAAGAGRFSSLTDTAISGSTQCVQANSSGVLGGTGSACGSGGSASPGGSSGQIQYNNAGAFGGLGLGDLTNNSGTLNVSTFNGGSAIAAAFLPAPVSGNWYAPWGAIAATGNAQAANREVCSPFPVLTNFTVKGLAVRITTPGSTTMAGAIYSNSGGLPNAALIASGSTADTGAAGAYTLGTLSPTTYTLTPGVYWSCVQYGDATLVLSGQSGSAGMSATLLGNATLADVSSASTSVGMNALQNAITVGTWSTFSLSTLQAPNAPPIMFLEEN